MPDEIYELVAQGARYWFLFLMVLIVWRSWRWYRKDKRQAKKRLKLLPDAGFIGEMIVVKGGEHLPAGTALPVPREGTLGFGRTNDLCIPESSVQKRHLWFRYDDAKGLMTEPFGKAPVTVDGRAFEGRRNPLYMLHGSRLCVGEAELRLRLFAGFEAVGHAARTVMPVENEAPQPDQAQQQAYEQWMAQQWMMQQAYQQGYQQAMAQQPVYEAEEEEILFDENTADVYTYEAAREQGMVDERAFMRPAGEKKPELPVYDEPVMEETEEVFYAPEADEDWNEKIPFEDDMTDAALPRSAYVGHDEAERAKRQVWDKYFGGGPR